MAEDKKLVMGVGSFNQPTPRFAKYILRGITYVGLVWTFLAPQLAEIPQPTIDLVNTWWLRIVGIVSITIRFLRWDYTDN